MTLGLWGKKLKRVASYHLQLFVQTNSQTGFRLSSASIVCAIVKVASMPSTRAQKKRRQSGELRMSRRGSKRQRRSPSSASEQPDPKQESASASLHPERLALSPIVGSSGEQRQEQRQQGQPPLSIAPTTTYFEDDPSLATAPVLNYIDLPPSGKYQPDPVPQDITTADAERALLAAVAALIGFFLRSGHIHGAVAPRPYGAARDPSRQYVRVRCGGALLLVKSPGIPEEGLGAEITLRRPGETFYDNVCAVKPAVGQALLNPALLEKATAVGAGGSAKGNGIVVAGAGPAKKKGLTIVDSSTARDPGVVGAGAAKGQSLKGAGDSKGKRPARETDLQSAAESLPVKSKSIST